MSLRINEGYQPEKQESNLPNPPEGGSGISPSSEMQKVLSEIKKISPLGDNPPITTDRLSLDNKISLCMIVKNEEARLHKAIKSFLPVVDEIIVVDTGSTDNTKKSASVFENQGVKVFDYKWNDDFSEARNFSLSKAQHNWIMYADADDLFYTDIETFIRFKARMTPSKAYMVNIACNSDGKQMMNFIQTRIFPNNPDLKFKGRIHEAVNWSIQSTGRKLEIVPNITIIHTGYTEDKKIMDEKQKRNYSYIVKEKHERADAWFFMGHYWNHFDNPYYAISCYAQLLIENKVQPALQEKAKFFIGYQFEKLNLYEIAIEWYESSKDTDALHRKAECYRKNGNILEAKKYHEEYYNLGEHYSPIGSCYVRWKEQSLQILKALSIKEAKYWSEQK